MLPSCLFISLEFAYQPKTDPCVRECKQDPHSSKTYSLINDATICLFEESGKSRVQHVCSILLKKTMKHTMKHLHSAWLG